MPLAPPVITGVNPVSVDSIQIGWTNGDYYTSTIIKKDGDVVAVLAGDATSFLFEGLGDGVTYVFTVTGHVVHPPDPGDDEYAESAGASGTTPLIGDSGLTGRAWPPHTSEIWWTINTSNATGHKILRDGGLIDTVGGSVARYDDSGPLTPGTWYAYQVVAVNAVAESAASNVCNIFIGPPPNAPSDPTAVAVATDKINIGFKDNSDDELGFKVEESDTGVGGWAVIATLGPGVQSYQRTGLASNTLKYYRIYAFNDSGDSSPTAVVNARTFAAISDPTNLVVTPFSDTEVEGIFQDNSSEEDGHEVYRVDAAPTVVARFPTSDYSSAWTPYPASPTTNWDKIDETPADDDSTYIYAESALVGTYGFTAFAVPAGKSIRYIRVYVRHKKIASGACLIKGRLRVGGTPYGSTAFVSPTQDVWNTDYYEWLLNPKTGVAWTVDDVNGVGANALEKFGLNGVTVTANPYVTQVYVEVCYEEAYALITTLAPNQDFYRDPSLTKGVTYAYKVRAKQGASFSGYSNEATATTISEPAAPTVLAISEVKDRSMRLTWVPTTGETGYKIEKSTDGGANYAEIAKVEEGVSDFLARVLTPATEYYFRVRAYNIAGNSGYAAAVHDTTDAAYEKTDFEKIIRLPATQFIYLVEINPKMTMSGWTLTGGKSYTYELPVAERGIDIEGVLCNGAAFTAEDSIADVESNASAFYFDFYGRKLYVHVPGGGDPINYMAEGEFWLYFTNSVDGLGPLVFNGKNYLPMVSSVDIPDVRQEISPLHEGNFAIDSGTISVKSMRLSGDHYWDKKFSRYSWMNRRAVVRMGAPGFTYAKYEIIFTGNIVKGNFVDEKMSFDLEDIRSGIHRDLPINKFWKTNYPALRDSDETKPIPMGLGTCLNTVPTCIDATNRKYKLRDGRIKGVTEVRQNETVLSAGTDYYVDYQRGVITLSRSLALENADRITVDFDGLPNSADELLENGADWFMYLCRDLLGMSLAELHLDSIYETKYLCTYDLAFLGYKETTSEEFKRMLERSINAFTFQDGQGRLGLRFLSDTPESDAKYIRNHHVFDFSTSEDISDKFSRVDVFHSEDYLTKSWQVASAANNVSVYKDRVQKPLGPIYTFLTSQADAEARAAKIRDGLGKPNFSFTVPALLFGNLPGDLAYFSRDRFPSSSGTANELLVRLLAIEKRIGERQTRIEAEVV